MFVLPVPYWKFWTSISPYCKNSDKNSDKGIKWQSKVF